MGVASSTPQQVPGIQAIPASIASALRGVDLKWAAGTSQSSHNLSGFCLAQAPVQDV